MPVGRVRGAAMVGSVSMKSIMASTWSSNSLGKVIASAMNASRQIEISGSAKGRILPFPDQGGFNLKPLRPPRRKRRRLLARTTVAGQPAEFASDVGRQAYVMSGLKSIDE